MRMPSFEVPIAQPSAREPDPAADGIAPKPTQQRSGVLFSQTAGPVERLPNPKLKWALIGIAVAGGVGGFAAYRLTHQPGTISYDPVLPPLSLAPPTISIGKP